MAEYYGQGDVAIPFRPEEKKEEEPSIRKRLAPKKKKVAAKAPVKETAPKENLINNYGKNIGYSAPVEKAAPARVAPMGKEEMSPDMTNFAREKERAPAYDQTIKGMGSGEELLPEHYLPSIATPLLVGLLGGEMGAAAGVAGRAIAGMQSSKEKLLKSMKGTAKGKWQLKTLEDGTPAWFNSGTGELVGEDGNPLADPKLKTRMGLDEYKSRSDIKKDEYLSLGKNYKVDRNKLGQLVAIDKTNLKPLVIDERPGALSAHYQVKADEAATKFNKEVGRPMRQTREALHTSYSNLDTGVYPTRLAIMGPIKAAEGGRVSDQDRAFYIRQLNIIESLKEAYERSFGKNKSESDRLIKEVRGYIENMAKRTDDILAREGRTEVGVFSGGDRQKANYLREKIGVASKGRKLKKYVPPEPKKPQIKEGTKKSVRGMSLVFKKGKWVKE